MEIRRTANAGVLLKLDGVSILLDGVCQVVEPYLATPPEIRDRLIAEPPDALVFTHSHNDHYDPDFAAVYQARANGVILGPGDVTGVTTVGSVAITPIKTRHIGKVGEISHFSYIIQGSKCIWFLGDASPLQLRCDGTLPRPDVVIAPFAYASSASAWSRTKETGAQTVVILHMPTKDYDPFMLWDAVESVTAEESQVNVWIPQMGESRKFL